MATSQNGYSANDRSVIASYTVPGTNLKIALRRGDVSVVLLEYLRRYNLEVEPLTHNPQDLWGYAERTIRGSSTTLSNHASGTAVDCRATAHPLGKVGTFTPQQVQALNNLLAWFEGVIRHGKNYTGRKDEMHGEIDKGMGEVSRIANKVRAGAGGGVVTPPPPATFDPNSMASLAYGMRNDSRVKALQRWLNAYNWRPALPLLPVTGNYLDQTAQVLIGAGKQVGVDAGDGKNVGPRFKAAFAARGARW